MHSIHLNLPQTCTFAPVTLKCALMHPNHNFQLLSHSNLHFCTPSTQINPLSTQMCTYAPQTLNQTPFTLKCALLHPKWLKSTSSSLKCALLHFKHLIQSSNLNSLNCISNAQLCCFRSPMCTFALQSFKSTLVQHKYAPKLSQHTNEPLTSQSGAQMHQTSSKCSKCAQSAPNSSK